MSDISQVIIVVTGNDEGKLFVDLLNEYLNSSEHMPLKTNPLPTGYDVCACDGGEKSFYAAVWLGAFNGLIEEEFLNAVKEAAQYVLYQCKQNEELPPSIQVWLAPEHGYVNQVFREIFKIDNTI